MSLSDLAAVGSFAGGLAVVASVIYLALQVRQSSSAERNRVLPLLFELTRWSSCAMLTHSAKEANQSGGM